MPLALTEGLIRQHASAESFRRGKEYYRNRAVISLGLRGSVLQAQVEGNQLAPYDVRIEFDDAGIRQASCSCPFDWEGWCKHIVAVLLSYLNEPQEVEERPTVAQLLSDLDADQLRTVLIKLASSQPYLADALEREISLLQACPLDVGNSGSRRTPVDACSFRTEVRSILHRVDRSRSSEAYGHVSEVVEKLGGVLDEAREFIEAGDADNALIILEAITEEYMDGWGTLCDSGGEARRFFEDLGAAWTEALLTAEPGPEQMRPWETKLLRWRRGLAGYGIEEAFDAALEVANRGPSLLALFEAESVEGGAPLTADMDLVWARLNVLERQQKHDEFLRLARAAGCEASYVFMLAKLGCVEEAVEHGLKSLASATETLDLARRLRDRGHVEEAIKVAEHGLSLAGRLESLATWLLDVATGTGRDELALKAALVLFREKPDLAAYLLLQELAGESWPAYRAQLLDEVRNRQGYHREGPVEILLHEGLVADAIAVVDKGATDATILSVVDAAMTCYPDWVIKTCRSCAEVIMNAGAAQYYHDAVGWLGRAQQAYHAAGRSAEWRDYWQKLMVSHHRKYKLVHLLKQLGY